jgi:hypothetical protein
LIYQLDSNGFSYKLKKKKRIFIYLPTLGSNPIT